MTTLNIAAYRIGTRALGPGLRSALWVQGCPFRCRGCYSPAWIPNIDKELYDPSALAKILTVAGQEGISISGGEPLAQSAGILSLLENIKGINPDYSVIVFTGYQYEQILLRPSNDPVHPLLKFVDVLIDGPYILDKNDNKGLRGSSNQQIHHLTKKYQDWDFEYGQRIQEYYVDELNIQAVGIPDLVSGFYVKNHLKEATR